jgi:hypothetical protein
LAAALMLTACGGGGDEAASGNVGPVNYQVARAQWLQGGIASYRFTLQQSCFCLPEEPIVITVRGGVVASARFTPSGTPLGAERLATLPTLSGLFALADAAYAARAARIDFRANATQGYLEMLYIDQDEQMADEERGYAVSAFEIAAAE